MVKSEAFKVMHYGMMQLAAKIRENNEEITAKLLKALEKYCIAPTRLAHSAYGYSIFFSESKKMGSNIIPAGLVSQF